MTVYFQLLRWAGHFCLLVSQGVGHYVVRCVSFFTS